MLGINDQFLDNKITENSVCKAVHEMRTNSRLLKCCAHKQVSRWIQYYFAKRIWNDYIFEDSIPWDHTFSFRNLNYKSHFYRLNRSSDSITSYKIHIFLIIIIILNFKIYSPSIFSLSSLQLTTAWLIRITNSVDKFLGHLIRNSNVKKTFS